MLSCPHDVDMFTWGGIVLSSPKRAHVDWNWPISREKSKNRLVCKNAVALAYYGSCRLLMMGSWHRLDYFWSVILNLEDARWKASSRVAIVAMLICGFPFMWREDRKWSPIGQVSKSEFGAKMFLKMKRKLWLPNFVKGMFLDVRSCFKTRNIIALAQWFNN